MNKLPLTCMKFKLLHVFCPMTICLLLMVRCTPSKNENQLEAQDSSGSEQEVTQTQEEDIVEDVLTIEQFITKAPNSQLEELERVIEIQYDTTSTIQPMRDRSRRGIILEVQPVGTNGVQEGTVVWKSTFTDFSIGTFKYTVTNTTLKSGDYVCIKVTSRTSSGNTADIIDIRSRRVWCN